MKVIKTLLAVIGIAAAVSCGNKGDKVSIPILAWYSIPAEYASEETYQELADAGFNINFSHIGGFDDALKALELGEKTGVKIMFTCSELSTDPEATVMKVKDHPALYGYFLRDEPAVRDFPGLAAWAERIKAVDDTHPLYLNLFPNYATDEVLGCTYPEYVHRFVEEVGLPLLSFDFYPVTVEGIRGNWWNNLEVIAKEAREAGIPFWAFALSTAHHPYPSATIQSLRLQFYTDLAYGAQGLQYFTYWCPTPGTWDFNNAPIGETGVRGPVYDIVKEMNTELQARAEVFMGAKVKMVRHTGETIPSGVTRLEELPSQMKSLDTHGKGAVVSVLENEGWGYLMIVNRSLDEAFDYEVAFNVPVKQVCRGGEVKKAPKEGQFHLEEGDCAIFRWKL
ncbi:MAG: hypothetical protein IJK05_06050 [Bacteroidales bacterium]|nr:hypothetical protein [Bacteroidales bacterium]